MKKKKLFILSPFHYNFFINNINAVWLNTNLFKNGNLYFYFLTYNTFKITYDLNPFKEIDLSEKEIEYKIELIKGENSTIEFIKNNKFDFDFYFLYPINVFSYSIQFYSFLEYFHIKEYFQKINTDLNFLNEETFTLKTFIQKNINEEKEIIKNSLLKKVYLNILSDKIFAFFYSKTTVSENIDLLYLILDQIIKEKINKPSENLYIFLEENSTNIYNTLYKLIGDKLNFLYMYINFNDDNFNINNKNSYKKLDYEYYINNDIYLSDKFYDERDPIQNTKFHLEEIYLYLPDLFSIEEIYYKLLNVYEYININHKNEIVEYYSPINIKIDIFKYINIIIENLEKKNYYDIYYYLNEINSFLKNNFHENSKEIMECPYCINGKIYNGKNKFFCNNCNFFLLKDYIKDRYNFNLTKRYLKILLDNKYITINYKGENRILYLLETKKGFYLQLLRK